MGKHLARGRIGSRMRRRRAEQFAHTDSPESGSFPRRLPPTIPSWRTSCRCPPFRRSRRPPATMVPRRARPTSPSTYQSASPKTWASGSVPSYKELRPDGGATQHGFDNVAANIKYKFYQNDDHETILSVGADWDIGGTGARRVGAESFSTVTPAIFFGKGFGDLPDSAMFLRPLALTGSVGIGIPSRSSTTTISGDGDVDVEQHPHTLEWGFAIEYSLPYLQAFVKDVGLSQPFSQMIPVVEFALSTPLDRGRGPTTGTINPGILWAGRTMQLGLEAIVPINHQSGSKVGWIAQVHFFLDDLFPTSIGKPIFGSGR